ncbi:MAG TPA: tRNA pseudouridine(55) synthase TruB [Lacipirellula sp.]
MNLYKPAGWSSRDALNRVERLVRPAKAGHAGTLDPIAEGVLVVCLGPATRLIEYVQQMPKEYRATFLLGRRSASDDVESDVEEIAGAAIPTREEIEAVVPHFIGTISQAPPTFSAVKVDGKRAYKLARRGTAVELAPRKVEIYRLEIERHQYPELVLSMQCSSGTYVRSVGRDMAAALGTSAVMSALTRTAIGAFRVENSVDPRRLDAERLRASTLSPLTALGQLPRATLSDEQLFEVRRGGLLRVESLGLEKLDARPLAALDAAGNLVAILKEARPGLLKPSPNFLQTE